MNAAWSGPGHEHGQSITRDGSERLSTGVRPPGRDRTYFRLDADRCAGLAAGADLPVRRADSSKS